MSSLLAAVLLSSLPWLLGAAVALIITLRFGISGSILGISTAAGGVFGYILTGFLPHSIFVQTSVTRGSLWAHTLLLLAAASAVRLIAQVAIEKRRRYILTASLHYRITVFAVLLAVIAIYLLGIWQALLLPIQGWDVLDHWAPTAKNLIFSNAGNLDPSLAAHYHPLTISKILAWSSSASLAYGTSLTNIPWVLTWISIGMMVYFFARYHQLSYLTSLFSCYFTAAIPLLENHALIAGYGEIFVGGAILSSCILMSLGYDRKSMLLLFLGAVAAVFPIGLKNTGAFYSAATLFAALFLLHYKPRTILLSIIVGISIFSALLIYKFGISSAFFGNPIYHEPGTGYISIFGKSLWFRSEPSFTEIFSNHMVSWFVKGSFGLWFSVFLIALLLRGSVKVPDNVFSFLFATVTIGLAGLAASHLTVHGYSNGVPENDIGHSRFTLPFLLIVPPLCLRLLSLGRGQEPKI